MSVLSPVRAQELSISEYVASIGLNPSNVYYARYSSTNVSPQQAQWTIQSPNKRNLLLSYAQIEWNPTVIKQEEANAGQFDYPASGGGVTWTGDANSQIPGVSFKAPLPFANAMSSITISLNGTTQTMSQPRNFMHQLASMAINYEECKKCYEGSYWTKSGGEYTSVAVGNRVKAISFDEGVEYNEELWRSKALEGANQLRFNNAWGAVGDRIRYTEPIVAPPFNPFAKVMTKIPNYLWFKKMSHVIPHVDRLEVDIQFQKLAESIFETRYLKTTTAGRNTRLQITDLSADMLLYWYELPQTQDIPRSIDLQSWQVREFTQQVGTFTNNLASVESQLIQLRSVPTLMILSCIRDKDNIDYDGTAFSRDDDNDGAAGVGGLTRSNLDYWLRFVTVEVLMGDRPMVISTTFSLAELWYIHVKNSKYPYPYTFLQWIGKTIPRYASLAGNNVPTQNLGNDWVTQLTKMSIAFRPKDLAEKLSDGIFSPTTLLI